MKIALINPNSPFLINERVFPNIGLVRVATQLRSEGHDVKVFDFAGRSSEGIKDIAQDYDLFGFSSNTPQFPYVMNLFKLLKGANPNAKTIIGGPHVSALYHLKQKGIKDINIDNLEVFDTIFAGEGEETFKLFNLGWQKGNIINDIDDTLIPDRDFLELTSYEYQLFGKKTTSIQTQRGCPNQCIFCSGRDVEMYNRVRTHSPERVLQELDELHNKYGYSSFMWYDDEINVNIGRLERLCKLLSTRSYQHRGFIRSDMIVKHPESVKWMRDAGFVKLCAGVESGSDKVLVAINKRTTAEQNSETRRLIGDEGIHYEAFLIIGHPGETKEDVKLTIKWLRENKPDDFDITILVPYPGSIIYDNAKPSTKYKGYSWEYNDLYFNKPDYSKEDSFYKGIEGKAAMHSRTDDMDEEYISKMSEEIRKLKL